MRQPPITEFFPRIDDANGTLTLYVTLNDLEHKIGELELYEDDDRNWVNHIEVNSQWQRRGYGRMLIREATSRYGKIYFSTQTNQEAVDDNDTRHLSTEGAALAKSCIRRGLNAELRHPRDFEERSDADDSDGYNSG